jgi:hypothetical protein
MGGRLIASGEEATCLGAFSFSAPAVERQST